MKNQDEVCMYEVKLENGLWSPINMQCIEQGDVIRGRAPNGVLYPFPFENTLGLTEMIVLETPAISIASPASEDSQTNKG